MSRGYEGVDSRHLAYSWLLFMLFIGPARSSTRTIFGGKRGRRVIRREINVIRAMFR